MEKKIIIMIIFVNIEITIIQTIIWVWKHDAFIQHFSPKKHFVTLKFLFVLIENVQIENNVQICIQWFFSIKHWMNKINNRFISIILVWRPFDPKIKLAIKILLIAQP